MTSQNRWFALIVLCFGVLMIVLDTTIVNIALPSIRADLGFSESSLVWVVNAYLLTFGGFLLLSGRLGDLFGHRKLFLLGITLFTLASLTCGLAHTQLLLIIARAIQGLGGAIVSAVALSLIMNLFQESTERAKAMGVYSFVAAAGGSIGVLLGGILTSAYDWHWNFLINIPVGIIVFFFSLKLLPKTKTLEETKHIDIAGALTITLSLMLAVYAIVNGNQIGWTSMQTLILLSAAIILSLVFIRIESKVRTPLIPLSLFKLRNVATANIAAILWAAAMFAWFFLAALYLQVILGYDPKQVGLSFLPGNLIMAIFSLGLSAKIVNRFGIKRPLSFGLLLATLGFLYLARAPLDGSYWVHVFPSMVLLGLGGGIAFNPMLLAAMNDVPSHESGLASGLVNTSFMMGGALGLAILASVAAARTQQILTTNANQIFALNSGYHLAFLLAGCFAACACILPSLLLKEKTNPTTPVHTHM